MLKNFKLYSYIGVGLIIIGLIFYIGFQKIKIGQLENDKVSLVNQIKHLEFVIVEYKRAIEIYEENEKIFKEVNEKNIKELERKDKIIASQIRRLEIAEIECKKKIEDAIELEKLFCGSKNVDKKEGVIDDESSKEYIKRLNKFNNN